MYAGSSISVAAVIEHLLNMTRDVEDLTHTSWTLVRDNPSIEAIEKVYRQEISTRKDKIEDMKSRLFEYMASGRIEVIENSGFYLTIALNLERAAQSIDASVYRLLLFINTIGSPREETLNLVSELFFKLKEALGYLASSLRVLQGISGANREVYKILDQRVRKIKEAEEEADGIYRKIIAHALVTYKGDCGALTALKDLVDHQENAVDYVAEAGDYVRILGVSLYSR